MFGHRLQAKVAKTGERVVMDIEVSGTPQPTVTWYKDDKPLHETDISTHKITSSGNSHTLTIEKGKLFWIQFDLYINIHMNINTDFQMIIVEYSAQRRCWKVYGKSCK